MKKELAETVNKQFGKECYNLWGSWTVWGIPHTPKVKDVGVFTLPNGDPASPGTGGYVRRAVRLDRPQRVVDERKVTA